MKLVNAIIIILVEIFLVIFLYTIFYASNNIIGIKIFNRKISYGEEESLFDTLKNKYKFKKCTDMCNKEICDDFTSQSIKYDLCKKCEKENKCYDVVNGICGKCNDKGTCEEKLGCNNKKPVNPLNNYCIKCWK